PGELESRARKNCAGDLRPGAFEGPKNDQPCLSRYIVHGADLSNNHDFYSLPWRSQPSPRRIFLAGSNQGWCRSLSQYLGQTGRIASEFRQDLSFELWVLSDERKRDAYEA